MRKFAMGLILLLPISLLGYERGDLQGVWERTDSSCKGCRIQVGSNKFETMRGSFVKLHGKYAKVFNTADYKWRIHGKVGENKWELDDLKKKFNPITYEITGEEYISCVAELITKTELKVTCDSGGDTHWKKVD